MSIKFRKDGAVFPTSVENGVLTVYMGEHKFSVNLPFLKEDYQYDNSYFPVSNIMCYLNNGSEIIVMRFDGSVTKFTQDYEVTGFTKFEKRDILGNIILLPVGCVFSGPVGNRQALECSVYILKDTDCTVFECVGDPEAIVFDVKENKEFADELARGTRIFPSLWKRGANDYVEDQSRYEIKGYPMHLTGTIEV